MLKHSLILAALTLAGTADAQKLSDVASVCPAGTALVTIRHNSVNTGKWSEFEQAVAGQNAWYAGKGSKTKTTVSHMLTLQGGKPGLSTTEVVTITRYAGDQPAHDAGYAAFTAKYKDSAPIKDEMRVCMAAF